MLLLLLSRFSRIQLCVTPYTAANQAPPSLGFSRQDTLEGVASSFSNACMHAKSLQLHPTLCDPWTAATRLLCPRDSLSKNTGVGCHFLLQSFSVTGWKQRSRTGELSPTGGAVIEPIMIELLIQYPLHPLSDSEHVLKITHVEEGAI